MGNMGVAFNERLQKYFFFMIFDDKHGDEIFAVLTQNGWKKASTNGIPIEGKIEKTFYYTSKKKAYIDLMKLQKKSDIFLDQKFGEKKK